MFRQPSLSLISFNKLFLSRATPIQQLHLLRLFWALIRITSMVVATALSLEGLVAVDADVVRLRRGDLNALSELITRYQNRLYRYLLRIVRQPAEAEDLFQQTWLRVVEKIRSFDASHNFDAWLFTLARNLAIDHLIICAGFVRRAWTSRSQTAGIAKPGRTGSRVKTTRRSFTRSRPSAERRSAKRRQGW